MHIKQPWYFKPKLDRNSQTNGWCLWKSGVQNEFAWSTHKIQKRADWLFQGNKCSQIRNNKEVSCIPFTLYEFAVQRVRKRIRHFFLRRLFEVFGWRRFWDQEMCSLESSWGIQNYRWWRGYLETTKLFYQLYSW